MPMNTNLTSALSEFSKGRWAGEPPKQPPLRPTELNRKSEGLALPSAKIFAQRDLARFVGQVHKLILRMFQCLGDLRLVTHARSWLDNVAPVAFARYLMAFFIGVIAVLAWQSYRDGAKDQMIAAAPAGLDSVRQSVEKLAVEIAKVQAAEQDILDKISTPPPRPSAAPARNSAPRPSQAVPPWR
jgi:hypothetical protein